MIYGMIYSAGFIIGIILMALLAKTGRTEISKRLITLTGLVSFWILMEALSFYASTDRILIFQKLKYIGVIMVSPTLLVTAVIFISRHTRLSLPKKLLIYAIPAISLISVLTNCFPYRFMLDPKAEIVNHIPMFTYTKDIGFMINAFYSYLLILSTCYLLLLRAIRSPKIYRKQSMFVFSGCFLSFGINLLFISQPYSVIPIDTTPLFVLTTLVFFYWGVYQLPKSSIVPYARNLVIENIKDLLLVVDNDDRIIDINPTAQEQILKYAHRENTTALNKSKLIGSELETLLEYIPQLKDLQKRFLNKEEKTLVLESDRKTYYYGLNIEEVYDSDNRKIGKLYILHDITQMKQQLNDLIQLNGEMVISDMVINSALEGIIITDADNIIIRINASMERMSGFVKEELLGSNPRIMKSDRHDAEFYQDMWKQITEHGSWEGEIWDKKKNGEIYPKWMSIITIRNADQEITNYIGISSDISKMKEAENDIQLLAYYDALTGIPNRTLFYDRLRTALLRSKRDDSSVAVFFMDLDRFKYINDSLGHDAGDQLLIEVSKRIKSIIRESDTLCRLGGDEFTLIIEGCKVEEAVDMAERIGAVIKEPFAIQERQVTVGISIGIALAPFDDLTVEGIIRKADSAMYHAKETGRGRFAFSSEDIEKRNHEQLEMQLKLKEALQKEEFQLFLQPQISLVEGRYQIVGAEALIRWERDGRLIPPVSFIPSAEENGLILPIGSWVIREVFCIDRILKENGIFINLAFNVSVKQFEDENLIHLLEAMMVQNSYQNIRLIVEITESMFINNLDRAIAYLNEIKALGISIALDDFGTGYSSMSFLTKLPVDILKIDKSFVDRLDDDKYRNLTYTIISMAKTLNLKTLAEGVETKIQADSLISKNCDELQGYFFSKPLPVKEFMKFYQEMMKDNI